MPPANSNYRLSDNEIVGKALAYMQSNYMYDIRWEDVARSINRSKNGTSRLFKQILGINIRTALNNIRISAAQDLLRQGIPLKQAAMRVGFNDSHYFNRVFSGRAKISPGIFAKKFSQGTTTLGKDRS